MDNDGTLMDFKAAEANALGSVLNMLKIESTDAEAVYSEINARCWQDFEKGIITQEELRLRRFRELLEYFHLPADPESTACAAEAYVEALAHQSILLLGALEVVKKIAEHMPVMILTNGISYVQHGRIDHSPLAPYLSGLLISTEIGAPKPAPDMYLKALEMAKIRPEEALMIGDSLTSDIQGAINAGVAACWYNPGHKPRPDNMRIDYEIDRMEQMAEIALMD